MVKSPHALSPPTELECVLEDNWYGLCLELSAVEVERFILTKDGPPVSQLEEDPVKTMVWTLVGPAVSCHGDVLHSP